eukprot:TRINITY_DN34014_c0_g1_i2.p1 TRINITY_DN34014_c0_g1~~TRINITY_DN34014_c0_g1_i2.p1  ORF type:complete len:300 (+),score=10.89 TRINITY_DN34014_c0_g1_i2:83-901(+)
MTQPEVTIKSAITAFSYFTILGLSQCILASSWSNLYGALVGATGLVVGVLYGCFLLAKFCEKRKGYYLVEQGIAIRYYKEFNFAFVMTRVVQTLRQLKAFQIILGLYLALLLLIRASSPDEFGTSPFPTDCNGLPQGCARIASVNPHRDSGLTPVQINSNMELVKEVVKKWIENQPRSNIIGEFTSENPNDNSVVVFHARFVSLFLGFADDFFVSLGCGQEGAVIVQVQSQLRIGRSVLGVNKKRVKDFMVWMQSFEQSGALDQGSCSQTLR